MHARVYPIPRTTITTLRIRIVLLLVFSFLSCLAPLLHLDTY